MTGWRSWLFLVIGVIGLFVSLELAYQNGHLARSLIALGVFYVFMFVLWWHAKNVLWWYRAKPGQPNPDDRQLRT